MKRVLCISAALLPIVLGIGAPVARANSDIQFNHPEGAGTIGIPGAPVMKNLYVDLIFWGWGNTIWDQYYNPAPDVQQVLNSVQDLATWLNSGWVFGQTECSAPPCYLPGNTGAGWEPAIHSYGVSGIAPGFWTTDPDPIPSQYLSGGSDNLDYEQFLSVVEKAQAGGWGAERDFRGNWGPQNGLPIGSNRLALVITKGTNRYSISFPEFPPGVHEDGLTGFHEAHTTPPGTG